MPTVVWTYLSLGFVYFLYFKEVVGQTDQWGEWSVCTQSCDIGTRTRSRTGSPNPETETEYCNTHYCPEDWTTCNSVSDCRSRITRGDGDCSNERCRCILGDYHNINNCHVEVGECKIRVNPPTALGSSNDIGPSDAPLLQEKLYSCTTKGNTENEVHVIGIDGSVPRQTYQINIVPRGPIVRPIILILTSALPVSWKVNTTVDILEVVYRARDRSDCSTVEAASDSDCYVRTRAARANMLLTGYGYYSDYNDETADLIRILNLEYGQITSFTGYGELRGNPVSKIDLKVGGNPLAVLPESHKYDLSQVTCTADAVWNITCVYTDKSEYESGDGNTWGSWTSCSTNCNIGTRIREKCDRNGQLIQRQEAYCNLKYCEYTKEDSCKEKYEYCQGNTRCFDGVCRCIQGEEYITNNCLAHVGNCHIFEDPPTALGYQDPSISYKQDRTLFSCTTSDNPVYEVHIISMGGKLSDDSYRISVVPKGPVTKPIILILTSVNTVDWKVNSDVGIYRLFYGGRLKDYCSLEEEESSRCKYSGDPEKISEYGHGFDGSGDKDTLNLLKSVTAKYGPVTSFTGYTYLIADVTPRIILNVGGNPLEVLPKDHMFDVNSVSCTPVNPPENPVIPTVPPLPRQPGTMQVTPNSEIQLKKGESLKIHCHFEIDNNEQILKDEARVYFFNKNMLPVSGFALNKTANDLNTVVDLVMEKEHVGLSDANHYHCMDLITGKSAGVNVRVFDDGPIYYFDKWSSCSVSCDIGTRHREVKNSKFNVIKIESQYCSLNYCPVAEKSCSGSGSCILEINETNAQCADGSCNGKCVDGVCKCKLGEGYEPSNCYPVVENCIVRKNPISAIGYQDSSYSTKSDLYSCTTTDKSKYEVHVISIRGDKNKNVYTVTIVPQAAITKPIILYLVSVHGIQWKIESPVAIYKVLYGSSTAEVTTAEKSTSSACDMTSSFARRSDLHSGYGDDTDGGSTPMLLKLAKAEYGSITSFTGYDSLDPLPPSSTAHITLHVGGDPLSAKASEYKASVNCTTILPEFEEDFSSSDPKHLEIIVPCAAVGGGILIASAVTGAKYMRKKRSSQNVHNPYTVPMKNMDDNTNDPLMGAGPIYKGRV